MPRGMRSGKSIMEEVLNFFLKHRNQVITLEQICGELELEPYQARANINNLKNHPSNQFDIQTLIRGRSWIYQDAPLLVADAVDTDLNSIIDNAKSSITTAPVKSGKSESEKRWLSSNTFRKIGEMKDGSVLLRDANDKFWKATEL